MNESARAPLNRLRKEWREGRPTFGAIATIPSIPTVQIMAQSGLDWIIVDLEHGPIDLTSAHAMITATVMSHAPRIACDTLPHSGARPLGDRAPDSTGTTGAVPVPSQDAAVC